ncbi:MAG: UDP-2,4-diacetamido-2,4,6-trideoxy-beta-L-altropyranose hydrolase [Sporomusaceae bacterium]|nr:UDP-2,4-diacetamido-2,4,6-trideoxy-beta-L-altropyranose hydrolase [Sporomusaceae bacterium]
MKIVIRTDSSRYIGSGHIMRCLTLAEFLRRIGAKVSFVCRDLPGNVAYLVEQNGFPVHWLSIADDADWEADACKTAVLVGQGWLPEWLIVDHYGLDARWERLLRPFVRRVMVIDDLANREHVCNILLDANFYLQLAARYEKIVPPDTRLLLGPQFTLLRSEFSQVERHGQCDGSIKRILAFFGGSDPTNETEKLLAALKYLPERSFGLDVVVGAGNSRRYTIEHQCELLENVRFFCQVNNMAELMAQADLAIGAGGTTLWERCYLGLPSIVIAVADNQIETSQALAHVGAIHYLGYHADVSVKHIATAIRSLLADSAAFLTMARKAKKLVPVNGTEAVVRAMLSVGNVLVTSAGRKIPLLNAIKKAMLKADWSGKLIVADNDTACLAQYFADEFWAMPRLADLPYEVLLAELQRLGVCYVIPTRDGELPFWSGKRELLRQSGIHVLVSKPDAVSICLDKLAFCQRCRQLAIPAVSTSVCLDDLVGKYFVVKDRYGAGSRQIGLNLSCDQAREHARSLEQPIFQPFISGKEYSVDAYVDKQGQVKGVICRSRDVVSDGESQVTTTVSDAALEYQCREYITKLGLYGHVILQVIVDGAGQIHVLECNARFGGASTLSIAAGLDSFYWFLLEAQGADLAAYPFNRTKKLLRQVRAPHDSILEVN